MKSTYLNMLLLAAALLPAPAVCKAGAAKTGGGFEMMADAVTKAGMAPVRGGNSILYQSIGQQAGYITKTGGAFALVGGFLGVVDETPPTIALASPTDTANINGSVNIVGTAFDENGSTWTLYYGPGQSPARWKQLGAGSQNQPGIQMASWDTSNIAGPYTIRVVGVDARGNSASATVSVNVWNKYEFSNTIPADAWSMVAVPGNPLDPDPRSFLGNGRYEAQRWDPSQAPDENDLRYKITFPVTAGDGFWIKPYKTPITYSLPAWVQDTTTNVRKRLENGWNQIGIPFNRAVAWNNFRFKRDGDASAVYIVAAIANGWVDSKFYSYGGSGFQANDAAAALQPFVGYFVRAYTGGELQLDPGAGLAGGVARIVRPVYEWRMQIVAETDSARDAENYLGEMKGATDTFNPADSAEPPTVEPYVTAYFPHPEWGRLAGRYAADIRSSQEENAADGKSWTFVVKTSEPNKPVTLTWPGAEALPGNYRFTVRDDAAGREIDPKSEPLYQCATGEDGTRAFTITAKKLAAGNPGNPGETGLKTTIPAGWSLFSVPLETSITDVRDQLGPTLAKLNIYQHYDRKLFGPDSESQVDIQAGIGYWAYAEAPVDAEFRGKEIAAGVPVDVPLADGWNVVGNPFKLDIIFGDGISVIRDGQTLPLSEAARQGWIDGRLFRYSKDTQGWQAIESGNTLSAWEGFVIKAHGPCALRFIN